MSSSKRTAHYVASTHWDREWYQTFQEYRRRLVLLMDELIDTMNSDPAYRYYNFDGQTIPIEDYLEIRPEREPQLRKLIEEGRLRVGPWYVMPDEFLVSGESLIRNLRMGVDLASEYGEPCRAGFVCDIFGHISQLPQIFRGFNIDNTLLWRGVNDTTHGAMFNWESPDGSDIIAYRFSPKSGYCTYAFLVRHSQNADEAFDWDTAMKGLRELTDFEMERCPTDSLLLFDGGDHLEIEPHTTEIIKRGNEQLEGVEIVHSHLEGFIEDLREQRDAIKKTFVGELREPTEENDDGWLIPGVLSSRIPIKQANARCENALTRWAEPFSVFAATLGRAYPETYLKLAWKYLIQNHPHDSICGCSIDQVHKDMEYRFDQCEGIAEIVTRDSVEHIASCVQVPELGENDFALVVFNPGADDIDGPTDLTVKFSAKLDTIYQEFFGFEQKVGFRMYDADGNEVGYQYVNAHRNRQMWRRPNRKFPDCEAKHVIDITLPLKVPAYGYTTLVCKPVKEPTRYLGTMQVDDHTIENEFFTVGIDPNGTVSVTDKRSDETYDGLLTLENRADIGDGWFHGIAVNDEIQSSVASSADVALTADGICKATLKIRVTMQVAKKFEFGDSMRRSDALETLVVTHYVTLRQGVDRIEVKTDVDNNVRDHRLRVLFPSFADTETYLSEQAFDVVERKIAIRSDNARYKELEVETRAQQAWTAVHDNDRGLAVISTGLPESTVRDIPSKPIALTLLRGTTRTVMTSGQPGGEIQGRHTFRYWIVPLNGKPDNARLCRMGQELAAGVRAVVIEPRDITDVQKREMPLTHSFMSVDSPSAIITAVHQNKVDDAPVVRLYNPTDDATDMTLTLTDGASGMTLVDFEGNGSDALTKAGKGFGLNVKPRQIRTIRIDA